VSRDGPGGWNEIVIPTSAGLAALRNVGVDPRSPYRPPVVGGGEAQLRQAAEAAFDRARERVSALAGGWPLDRKG
jgi:hypothetical protein